MEPNKNMGNVPALDLDGLNPIPHDRRTMSPTSYAMVF